MNCCGGCDNVICIQQGDDYNAADGRALCFSGAGCHWPPGLTGATLILEPVARGCGCPFPSESRIDGDVTYSPPRACFNLTAGETIGLALGYHALRYRVVAQTAAGHAVTLDSGKVTVK